MASLREHLLATGETIQRPRRAVRHGYEREVTDEGRAYWSRIQAHAAQQRLPAKTDPPCEICGDMGWVTKNVPVGHPDFGKAFPCTCRTAQCMQQQRFERLFKASGLMRPQYQRFSMADYESESTVLDADELELMAIPILAAQRWAAGTFNTYTDLGLMPPHDMPDGPRCSVVFYGPPGYGKTSLASAAFRSRMERTSKAGLVVEYYRLISEIQSHYGSDEDQSYQMVQELASMPLLMLDDLGNEDLGARRGVQHGRMAETDDRQQKVYSIIDGRYVDDLPTLITTNLGLEDMAEQFGDRVLQRLFERAVWVPMDQTWLRGKVPPLAQD